MEQKWRIRAGAWQTGPYTLEQLRDLALAGELQPTTLIQSIAEGKWKPAANQSGIFPRQVLAAQRVSTTAETTALDHDVDEAQPPCLLIVSPNDALAQPLAPPRPEPIVPGSPSPRAPSQLKSIVVLSVSAFVLAMAVLIALMAQSIRDRGRQTRLETLTIEVERALLARQAPAARLAQRKLEQVVERHPSPRWTKETLELAERVSRLEGELAAEELWTRARRAINDKQYQAASEWLRKYASHPHATQLPDAQALLKDLQLLVAEDEIRQLVAPLTDDQLKSLEQGKHTLSLPAIGDLDLHKAREELLRLLARQEVVRREELARKQAVELAAATARTREEALQRESDVAAGQQAARQRDAEERELLRQQELRERATDRVAWRADVATHGALRLVPAEAIAAVGVRNPKELKTKASQWFTEIGAPELARFVSTIADPLLEAIFPQAAFDHTQPVALILAHPRMAKVDLPAAVPATQKAYFEHFHKFAVLVVPVKDLEKACVHWGINRTMLQNVGTARAPKFWLVTDEDAIAATADNYLFVGKNLDAVKSVAESYRAGETIVATVVPEDGRMLAARDAFGYLGVDMWGSTWAEMLESMENGFETGDHGEEAQATWKEFVNVVRHTRYAALGAAFDNGLKVRLSLAFSEHDDARVDQFLQKLNAGDEPPKLTALPHENALWAFAARGQGLANVVLAQTTFEAGWNHFLTGHRLAVDADRPQYYARFASIWRHIQAARAGLYHVGGDEALGRFASVAIFDSSDADATLADVRRLIEHAEASAQRVAADAGIARQFHFQWEETDLDGWPLYIASYRETAPREDSATRKELGNEHRLLRFVPLDNQIVVFVGSDLAVLRQTVVNLLHQRPGLNEHPAVLAMLASHSPRRSIQLGVSAEGAFALLNQQPQLVRPQAYSSTSLAITSAHVRVDIHVPTSEARATYRGWTRLP